MALSCQVSHDKLFRYIFYILNLILVIFCIVFFILGFVSFEQYNGIYLGSFVGGWVTSVSIFYFCIGSIGVIGSRYNHISLLGIYAGVNLISLLIRILTMILFSVKHYSIHYSSFIIAVSEVVCIFFCVSILMVILDQRGMKLKEAAMASSGRNVTVSTVSASSHSVAQNKNHSDSKWFKKRHSSSTARHAEENAKENAEENAEEGVTSIAYGTQTSRPSSPVKTHNHGNQTNNDYPF